MGCLNCCKSKKKGRRNAAVVVVGDIGRSPRM